MLSDQTLRFGEELCTLTLGIDKLYRAELGDQGALDGLAVINMDMQGKFQPDKLSGYEQAREALAALAAKAFALPEEDRRLYYTQACISLDSFCASRQGKLDDLSAQIDLFLHVDPAPMSQAVLEDYQARIRAMLTDMGYTGSLAEQCAKWEQKNIVPADEVQGVMDELMAVAREKTARILDVPEGDYYRCETERNAPFNARSDYHNRCVVINIDPILTRPSLKHLVCHECYPGHFMQFSLRQRLFEKGVAAADGLLSVVNHASSSTFEGIADMSMEFIDWAESDDDKVNVLISEQRSALATTASYMMHKEKRPDSEVRDYLTRNSLVGGEGWVENRMGFITDTARSALIWSYWRGDQGVEGVWRRVAPPDRARFFDYIYGRLHTVQSMQLFR